MLDADYFYTVSPKMKLVKKQEFEDFIKTYPRKLERDVFGVCEPPSVTYNDFELANRWPYSIVANTWLYSEKENDIWYLAEEERKYFIMENYKEVFESKTGKMAGKEEQICQ